MLTFRIENETDLHTKVVTFLKTRYQHSLLVASLGGNQDSPYKRIDSYKKGYLRGSPDLMVLSLHKITQALQSSSKTQMVKGFFSHDQML